MFFGLVLLLLSNDKRIEANSYEDKVRELLGKDAYLLFVFDKVVFNVSKKFFIKFGLDFETNSELADKLGQYREYQSLQTVLQQRSNFRTTLHQKF